MLNSSGGAMGWQCAPNNGRATSLGNPNDGAVALEVTVEPCD